MRCDEFRNHPLWNQLEEHTKELADFIRQKREEQAVIRARDGNQNPHGQMASQHKFSSQKDPACKFMVTKDWSNAPKGFKKSDAHRA